MTGIKKYIIDITVIYNPYNAYDEMFYKVNELQTLIPNVKINIPNDKDSLHDKDSFADSTQIFK
jgi:hypothetical protein